MVYQSEQQNNIQDSFDLTLMSSDLQNLSINVSEIIIDSLIKDRLLKDIPIVSTLANLVKIGANIHDKLFLKKILTFLNSLKDISVEDRNKMIRNIDDSKQYRIKVGEKLLYIIDRSEDYEISELAGLVFKYFIEGKIKYIEFLKTSTILNNLTISDFKRFIKMERFYHIDLDNVGDLIGTGLFDLHYEQVDVRVEDQDDHRILLEKYGSKYKTQVEGGGVDADVSRSGEILLEIFSPIYKKPRSIKI